MVFYLSFIFYLSSQPPQNLGMQIPPGLDKLIHFLEFGVLGFILSRSFIIHSLRERKALLLLAGGIFYAGLDEIHQMFVPMRESSLGDFLSDSIGLTLFYIGGLIKRI